MNSVLLLKSIPNVMARAVATGLFVSICTIKAPTGGVTGAGQPTGLYVAIAELSNIACMAPPQSTGHIEADETKTEESIMSGNYDHVLLDGYYGQAVTGFPSGFDSTCQANVDGLDYDILGVEHDSQSQMTRMLVRAVGI